MTSSAGPPLPAGTVTFLFLDIERSTELLGQVGADYPRLLEMYRSLTERSVKSKGGVVFGSEGDGLFAAFPEAGPAALAAVEVQRAFAEADWPAGARVRARMGIHTGSPTRVGDDYTGIDVHRAARIMSAGWGEQILISETTEALLVATDLSRRDLGSYTMKGLSRHERLFQLEGPGLRADFPAPRARRRKAHLPRHLTSLIGREADVDSVIALLDDGARLVTVSGPGGIGKTRIALAVAERMDPRYPDGVVFVDVSKETEFEGMAVGVADAVGANYDRQQSPVTSLIEHLAPMHMLLVVDGFERFSGEAVEIADLLAGCPQLQLLVTSRVVLRIGVEREHRVLPLPVAPADAPFEMIASSPAVRLFVERAAAVRPGLELSRENAGAIRDLVTSLEGVPLSIELAAARARLLTPDAILDRLESLLDLEFASPELPERQRSLRATIEWSHGMLSGADQRLLHRLAVFVDGWTVEAAEAVAGEEAGDVLLGLENLVAQSLVQVEPDTRMSMGAALRDFASELLAATGDEESTRRRHAEYFARVAEHSDPLLRGPRQREVLNSLFRDWYNFRSAGFWALDSEEIDLAGRLYVNLWILSWQSDKWRESEAFTRRIAPHFDQLDEALRARALFLSAGTYMEMGNVPKAIEFARPAIELAQKVGDRATESWSRLILAGSSVVADVSIPEARQQIGEAVSLARSSGDPFLLAYSLSFQGAVATLDGDPQAGLAHHHECLDLARSLENLTLAVQAAGQIAMTELVSGNPPAARRALEDGLDEVEQARSIEVLALYLDAVAWLAFAEDDPVRAMTSLGAADGTRTRVGAARWTLITGLLDAAGVAAETERPELAEARRAGAEMSPHDAISFGLQPQRELAATG